MGVLKKYRLRSIQHLSGKSNEHGVIEIESVSQFRGVLIITYDTEKYSYPAVTNARKHIEKTLGMPVLMLPNDLELFVFEEVKDGESERDGGSGEDSSGLPKSSAVVTTTSTDIS